MEDTHDIIRDIMQHYEDLIYQAKKLGDPEPNTVDWDAELRSLDNGSSYDSGFEFIEP